MPNEFIIKNGYISKGNSVVENGFTASTISATTYFNLPSSTFTGGTVTGSTIFTNGLSANTISATTYQNLPVSGLTEGSNISLTNNSGNYTISVTGITSGGSFSGGTVTGPTVFLSGVTANTLTVNGVNITGDTYTTGGTYSNGTIQFNYNTGGGYQVTGLYTGQTSYVNSLTTGTGLSANTTTGDITIINTSPDQTVTITGGTNVSINGTYPNFGIELTGLTDNDRYTTGFTYNDNTFTISDNSGSTYNATFNTVTGLTVNGILNVTGNTIQSGVTATTIYTDYIDFNTGATVTQSPGRISWDSGTGTLNVTIGDGDTGLLDLQVGQEEISRVFNDEATTLQRGEIVYVYGSQGNRPSVKRALATNDGYSVTTLGMVASDILSGAEGYVTTFGIISNLNTLGLSGGTPIWLSPDTPGAYTSTKPIAPNHIVLIGYVVRVNATTGSVFINISNGWELDELHDVRISGATEGDLLVRSSYSGTPVWVNTKTLPGSYTITGDTNIESNLNVTGNTTVTSLNANTVNITQTPNTNNNNSTQILVRNSSTGELEYIDSTTTIIGKFNYGMANAMISGNVLI
jgi:hypothetical protein